MYIVDKESNLLPIGVAGEICVGGVPVAHGYLNRADLTAEKFVQDPYAKQAGAKMYRTGDLGRWLPDGNIEYLGRIDDQVKIRGYRIELGEIETVLQLSPMVHQAVVAAKNDHEGNKRLVAYIVPQGTFDKAAITEYLQSKLPEYMVPALLMEMESLPLTATGKINRKALPDPDVTELLTNQYKAPRNEVETRLVEIWQGLLKVDRIGIEDNFFELGGHSVLVMRVIASIRKQLQVEVAIKDLFVYPTIAALAKHLALQSKGLLLPAIEVQPRPDRIPLSFSQERLWFIDRLEGSVQYHVTGCTQARGQHK